VQKSGDAAAWATFAPMRLHRQNQCRSMNTLCILAPSATIRGQGLLAFWQIRAPPGICLSFETGVKRAKREKNECDGKTTNLVVAKKRAGND